MGHRLMHIYNLLKAEQIGRHGISAKEILDRICAKYNMNVGKGIRRQVAIALRRGLDYGILKRKRNKYRFDPTSSMVAAWKSKKSTRRVKRKSRLVGKSKGKNRNVRKRVTGNTEGRDKVPRPKLPPAPTWKPKRRNLLEEVLPKVKKNVAPK